MPYDWGPHYIIPSKVLQTYSGQVLLREDYDDELLAKELAELDIAGNITLVNNPWYFRKKGTTTWTKIGESSDRSENFPVRWDTTGITNGQYEVLGLMHISVRGGDTECTIARQNVVEVTIKN